MQVVRNRHVAKPNHRNGAAIVELAIVLPLLLLLLMGTIEACSAMHLQQSIDIASYEAVRTSLLPKSSTTLVKTTAEKFLANRNTKGATVSISPVDFETAPIGTTITVTISAPSDQNLPVSPFFFKDRTIVGSCSMMKEYQ
jgi:Flp pilus assembly protein TadG